MRGAELSRHPPRGGRLIDARETSRNRKESPWTAPSIAGRSAARRWRMRGGEEGGWRGAALPRGRRTGVRWPRNDAARRGRRRAGRALALHVAKGWPWRATSE